MKLHFEGMNMVNIMDFGLISLKQFAHMPTRNATGFLTVVTTAGHRMNTMTITNTQV